jgi:uncharacterized membrane protein YfcA
MDALTLAVFLAATFVGALTSGLSGFAMGLVVSGVWLHIITPAQTAVLIVLCGLVSQALGIWKVRHAFAWRAIAPFIVGGVIGVPLGTLLLTRVDQHALRLGIGVLLVIYAIYNLARPQLKPVESSPAVDLAVGVANGFLGGLTGLGGIVVTVWCQLRGGPKDKQRAVFQPVIFATFITTTISLGFAGALTIEILKLYALTLPALALGLWTGLRLYGKLDDAAFRKAMLWLLLLAGVALIAPIR